MMNAVCHGLAIEPGAVELHLPPISKYAAVELELESRIGYGSVKEKDFLHTHVF
jgi:hypothetical protein